MTLRELVGVLTEHADAWPGNLDREIYVRVGREIRALDTTYVDTGFVLVAGRTIVDS